MKSATRIAVVADTHIWPTTLPPAGDDYAAMLLDQTDVLHTLLLEELDKSGAQLVIHLGDLTCGGGFFGMPPAAFSPLMLRLRSDFAALKMPVHALPGNHDAPPQLGGWTLFETLWGLDPGLGSTIDLDGITLLLINAQGHDAAQIRDALPCDPVYGWVSGAEIARVEASLAAAAGRPVLAFVHQLLHPWRTQGRAWKPYYGVQNAAAVLETLARHSSVRALFQGHAHRYELGRLQLNGFDALSVLAPSVIEYPVGWLQLDVCVDCITVTLRQLPCAELTARSLSNGAQAWRAPASLTHWTATW